MKNPIIQEVIRLCQAAGNEERNFSTPLRSKHLGIVSNIMLDCPEKPEGYHLKINQSGWYKSICLTSGGADSTIAWYEAGQPQGLYIDIGQPYAIKEINVLRTLGIKYAMVDLRLDNLFANTWKHIVPGRNLLFLTIAAELLVEHGYIYFAMVSGEGESSSKGDKSLAFVDNFIDWYYEVTGKRVRVVTSIDKTKAGWLKWFIDKGHDLNIIRYQTVTCFSGTERPCGRCQACLRKYLSFLYNNIDIAEDYEIHPMIGGKEFVDKYLVVLKKALDEKDFTHYSYQRCTEDLEALHKAKELVC